MFIIGLQSPISRLLPGFFRRESFVDAPCIDW
jgi:hypothetical protein